MKKIVIGILLLMMLVGMMSRKVAIQDLSQYRSDTIQIEVKGEIQNPGVYTLKWNATIKDAIAEAGGIKEEANLNAINQNQALENNAVIIIPKISEIACVSINTGDLDNLVSLPGIGVKTAERIIEYRNSTPFQFLTDIMKIKGIGEKSYEKIRDRICL